MDTRSQWIWVNAPEMNDCYGEFFVPFQYNEGCATLLISADANYSVILNGRFVNSGQYPDYPDRKVFDRLDISSFCSIGVNILRITVWHYGLPNMSYFPGPAALRFEIYCDDTLSAYSCGATPSRLSPTYKNGYEKQLSSQLGFSFLYDASKDDDWSCGFAPSRVLPLSPTLSPRPVEKLTIEPFFPGTLIASQNERRFLYDLGQEQVGYFSCRIRSAVKQQITVSYGEHIEDGGVRRQIDNRDFSLELIVPAGTTEYTNYFRRLGLRYLEVRSEHPVTIEAMGIRPCTYPLKLLPYRPSTPLRRKIYDTALRTLRNCMHDHYEDCPWREQALYTMDSRNQMLCGYYAFGETKFPSASLMLFAQSQRKDNFLPICAPTSRDLAIPSFSLHYFLQVYEYTLYSKDTALARKIMPKLESIMNAFLSAMQDGLVPSFPGKNQWNFYEWAEGLDGNDSYEKPEAALNCLLSLALDRFQKICDLIGLSARWGDTVCTLNKQIRAAFYDSEKGMFRNRRDENTYSELVNSLAILCGAAGENAPAIAEVLSCKNDLTSTTLSMLGFKYDALLLVDKNGYRKPVLMDISQKYGYMLRRGATTFWETLDGASAFQNAGSLCHGWSALPVYYYHILNA